MELGTLLGFILGIFFMVLEMFIAADYNIAGVIAFLHGPSALIVIGGTLASGLIATKLRNFLVSFRAVGVILRPPVLDPAAAIDTIVQLANTARKEGVLALEESASNMGDQFLKKGIMLIVDGTDPELVKGIMETELAYIEERHGDVAGVYENLAGLLPAWGMIGTLIGLVLMLADLDDMDALAGNMAIALITTLYGSVLANVWAGPFGNKLRQINKEEVLLKTVLIEGMLSIQAGENPRIIEEKLRSFLAPTLRDDVGATAPGGGDE